jgi:hypothetical protein
VGYCSKCGAPWERITERTLRNDPVKREIAISKAKERGIPSHRANLAYKPPQVETLGWQPTCKCKDADKVPGLVLDPFAGAGTTAVVAKKLGRKSISIDASPDYCALATKRIGKTNPALKHW